jgi:hypothetical protein
VEDELTDIAVILDIIRNTPGCHVDPPSGLPALPTGLMLPADLLRFYTLAGGAMLFSDYACAGHIRILRPDEFQRIDQTIYGERFASGPFPWWYAVANVRDSNYISIDLNPDHLGNCYDSFHETFAMPGYVNIVAKSLTDFLTRLLNHREDSSYWLQDDFESPGEAFALYGYEPLA